MIFFSDIDIQFKCGGCSFHAVNMSFAEIIHDIPLHSHGINCYEIHYISNGYGILNADNARYSVMPNTLFVTGPLAAHSQFTDINDPMQEWCIYLRADATEAEKYSGIISEFLSRNFWIGQADTCFLPLFQKLFSELDNRLDGYRNMAGLLISEIIISIARNYIKMSQHTNETNGPASERTSIIIEEYFLYEYRTASLDGLSKKLGLSPRQTQRIIKKYYGSSFAEKKEEARMSAAAILLADNSLSLSDVSEHLGYASQEYFCTAFKKYYNISPEKFRKDKIQRL